MSVKRKKYSKQFKLDAIQMYENGEKSMAQVERELGITDGLLAKWRDELQRARVQRMLFLGTGIDQSKKHASGSWSGRMRSCDRRRKS